MPVTKEKILIVEDVFVEANALRLILEPAGYETLPLCSSVKQALCVLAGETPAFVLVDIFLKGPQTGIELGYILNERDIPFIYISANSDLVTLDQAKLTSPYGFVVKPFKEKDVIVTLEIARYHYQNNYRRLSRQTVIPSSSTGLTSPVIGQSKSILDVLAMVSIVAPAETSVLLLGESGTGKEIIAHRIHEMSNRSEKPLIKVNCAALPDNLIESDLFGHEKGAFSGAIESRKGKFERADGGTLFLDEIGELPYQTQSKLLRVLQEQEFERLGSNRSIKTDVRIIAATNRNLHKEIAASKFRLDLFYRLNVFPISLPPLRERKEDIEQLVLYFISKCSKRLGKALPEVTRGAISNLLDYHWPGNIRELENIVERMVILSNENCISDFQLHTIQPQVTSVSDSIKSLEELEREYIISVLRRCHGKIFGPGGAAETLQLKVSTLNYRIKKLGINKKDLHHP